MRFGGKDIKNNLDFCINKIEEIIQKVMKNNEHNKK